MAIPVRHDQAQASVKCLVVDDLEENILALSALLRDHEVEILTAASGVEALELLLQHEVALAFVDVQMPDMDGFELAELMRGSERTRHVPIIFVTAGARDQHRVFKGYDAGAVDFLYKPIDPRVLRHKAAVFFQLYRQKQQLAQDLRERTETLRTNEMFTAVLGHDLRNPLASIVAGARLLRRSPLTQDAKTSAILDLMDASTQRMEGLINDVLDLARSRLAGGIPIERGNMDLAALTTRVVGEHEAAFPGRVNVQVEGELSGFWDASRLAQVASNLIGNALHHGDARAPVEVRLDGTRVGEVMLSIANAGVIPSAMLPNLFDPFHGAGEMGRTKGLGLGLYIVQQIVQAHRGRVDVTTDDTQQRTVFSVTLPRNYNGILKVNRVST